MLLLARDGTTRPPAGSLGLQSLARHAVDDTVAAWVHEPDAVADGSNGEPQHDHGPQDDVEHDRVIVCVGRVHVQFCRQVIRLPAMKHTCNTAHRDSRIYRQHINTCTVILVVNVLRDAFF